MSNHIHLIIGKKENELSFSDINRDFNKHTSMHLIKNIKENPQGSRKIGLAHQWMMWMFERAGRKNANNTKHQFWRQYNHPIELSSNEMID